MNKTLIGYYHLKEDKVFHVANFECAAWYENILVKAGKYPIHSLSSCLYRHDNKLKYAILDASVEFTGIIQSDYFGTLIGGVPVGTYDEYQNAGQGSSYLRHLSDYEIADDMLSNEDSPYELLPEYEAVRIDFEYEGEWHTSHRVFLKVEGE